MESDQQNELIFSFTAEEISLLKLMRLAALKAVEESFSVLNSDEKGYDKKCLSLNQLEFNLKSPVKEQRTVTTLSFEQAKLLMCVWNKMFTTESKKANNLSVVLSNNGQHTSEEVYRDLSIKVTGEYLRKTK